MAPDKLVLKLEGNPDLQAYLATKAPGDECEFEVEAQLDELAGGQAVFSVTGATVMAEPEEVTDAGEDEEGKAEPAAELPEFQV